MLIVLRARRLKEDLSFSGAVRAFKCKLAADWRAIRAGHIFLGIYARAAIIHPLSRAFDKLSKYGKQRRIFTSAAHLIYATNRGENSYFDGVIA
jgi:hypothetical protein